MGRLYPNSPGFVSESTTSALAAESMELFSPSQADRCERWFKACTELGELKTCEECEIAARAAGAIGRHQSISARIRTDLFVKRQCLYKIATRITDGQPVKFWYTSNTFNLKVNPKGQIVFWTGINTTKRQAWLYGWGYQRDE